MTDRILVISPHPDDEVLGCGGTLKKLTHEGIEVFVLIVTRGKKELYSEDRITNVRAEATNAHKILGVTETRFFDFPAPDLDMISLADLAGSISTILKEFKVTTLYLPHRGDIHHDHKIVFNAGLVAARPAGDTSVKRIYSYETLSETEWAAPFSDDAFIPDRFVNISAYCEAKIEAMKCYKSQLRVFPNPRSIKSIEVLANLRGSTVGFTHAEAFMTIRVIEE